jgi:hypothetical protein
MFCMYGLLATAMVAALAASNPANDPDNTVSQIDVPGVTYPGVAMARPDRDPDRVTCRYETQPDSHFKRRICALRRDRQAQESVEQDHLMVYQRPFCGGGPGC